MSHAAVTIVSEKGIHSGQRYRENTATDISRILVVSLICNQEDHFIS
jgi:hypothetical protein